MIKTDSPFEMARLMPFCSMDAETGGCEAQACGSCSVPNHGTVERRLIAILSPTSDVILAPNEPAPLVGRRVCK